MKIQNVIHIVENVLFEISRHGSESATHMSDEDYQEVRQFLNVLVNIIKTESDNKDMSLKELNSSLQLIRNNSAKQYIFGKSKSIKRSSTQSSYRKDDEERISSFAGPEEKEFSVSSQRAEDTVHVAKALDKMGYVKLDFASETFNIIDTPALARIRNMVQVGFDRAKLSTVSQALERFDDLRHLYAGYAKNRLQPDEDTIHGQSQIKELTPNIMAFLAQVSRKRKGGEKWHEHLDPSNYENRYFRGNTEGYFTYDPHEAADELQRLGLAKQTKSGTYTLDKDSIEKSVREFKRIAETLLSGALLVNPISKTGAPNEKEQKVRQTINFVKQHFSDKIWNNAKKSVYRKMEDVGGSVKQALDFYISSKEQTGLNADSRVSKQLNDVDKTIVGTVIDFATAKLVLRKMLFDARYVLGNPKKNVPNFISTKDVSLAGRVIDKGIHTRKARV